MDDGNSSLPGPHEDVFKLQALGGVDGHHADLVLVAVVLIGIGQQGNVQQEVTQ